METSPFGAGSDHEAVRHGCLPGLSVVVGTVECVSRFRLYPTPAQEAGLLEHCGHARFVWNLAAEQ